MASLTHKIFAALKSGGDAGLSTQGTAPGVKSPAPASSSLTTPAASWNERFYHVAVQGCCHGELDRIYDACVAHERQTGKRIDVLICCGDFQAVRTASDMDSMAVPDKFKVMGDFHKYWSPSLSTPPAVTAPYLTIFVGGNHENSDLLAQESYGGFVAPNIYYLGHSGVVTVDDCLRVAGLSGIFKDQDYDRPYPPRPYAANYGWKKGAYHVRRVEVAKMHAYLRAAEALQPSAASTTTTTNTTESPPAPPLTDIFVSHDWPVGITAYGDEAQLLRYKPYFCDDIRRHALGNPYTMNLLREAKPLYWVAAHLHCYFEATVAHTFSRPLSNSSDAGGHNTAPAPTKFVALDKCAKGSGFLTFLDLPRRTRGAASTAVEGGATVEVNASVRSAVAGASRVVREALWLEVLRAAHPYVAQNSTTDGDGSRPDRGFDVAATVREIVRRHTPREGSTEKRDAAVTAAQTAPTTEALLAELQLSPALPLQQQHDQSRGGVTWATPAAPQPSRAGRQNTPQWAVHGAEDLGMRVEPQHEMVSQPQHQRRRTEAPQPVPWHTAEIANVGGDVVPPAAPAAAPAPLSFFEDVGSAPATSSAPSNNATAHTASAPTHLSWFEDTTS